MLLECWSPKKESSPASDCCKCLRGFALRSVPPRGVAEDDVSDDSVSTSADGLQASDAQSDASTLNESGIQPVFDGDLQAVIDAWPSLSEADRQTILAIIEVVRG